MIRIYIEDLVANAFIAYLSNSNPKNFDRKLKLKQIEKFGNEVVYNLRLKGKFATLILSRDLTYDFFQKYYDWYRLQDDDTVVLDDHVTLDDLIDNFTGYLSTDLLVEFGKRKNYKLLFE
ncbi:MAG: hypothetical protein IKR04_06115 [Clostridia bacterium]|nr:hypothetical protein [Clostridia bacterium]